MLNRCPGPFASVPASRRAFLKRAGNGFGMVALASLLAQDQARAERGTVVNPLAARPGHFPARAKRCIFLFMTGGPSHMDLYDPKPELNKLDGQPLPPSFGKIHSQFLENDPICLGSHRKFDKYGQAGLEMSDLIPQMHAHADDIAVIRSCVADNVIHGPESEEGVRRHDPARGDPGRRGSVLGGGPPAGALPGNPLPERPEPDHQPQALRRVLARPAAQDARPAPAGSSAPVAC